MAISSSKLATAILEVNDASFKWYVAGAVLARFIDWGSKGWLEKTGVPLGGLVIFAIVSGGLKLLYHVGDVIIWLDASQKNVRGDEFFVRVLVRIILWAERMLNVVADRILAGKMLVERLPAIVKDGFSWLLISYLALFTVEEFKTGWTQSYLHIDLNILFVFVIFLGATAIVLNREQKAVMQDTTVSMVRMSWNDYAFIGILSIVGGIVVYFKLKEFGLIGVAVAVFVGILLGFLSFNILFGQDSGNEYAE